MPTATLIKGMRTFDTVENRGYIFIICRKSSVVTVHYVGMPLA